MQDALRKDGRIHRDISIGNIVLVYDHARGDIRRGCLIDWEASTRLDVSGQASDCGAVVSHSSRS